jgi:hypothetical protein
VSESGRFPWKPALSGAGLLVLALATVSIRAQAIAEGRALLDAELRRSSLHRHECDLRLRIEALAQSLGKPSPAKPAHGEGARP